MELNIHLTVKGLITEGQEIPGSLNAAKEIKKKVHGEKNQNLSIYTWYIKEKTVKVMNTKRERVSATIVTIKKRRRREWRR